ncbi:MAG: hypothetical protein ACRDO7_18470 [Nocardioidaceae bacterium]
MRLPNDLGALVASHQPVNPTLALIVCSLPGGVIGVGLWLGAVGSAPLGAFALVLTTVLLVGLFAESLFVRQQVYEHGLLLSSAVPLTPRYVIPYTTIDPGSIAAEPYRRPRGAADVTDAFHARYRQAPGVGVVTFVAAAPFVARRIAHGHGHWADVAAALGRRPASERRDRHDLDRWYVSFRDNATVAHELRARVRRSAGRRWV